MYLYGWCCLDCKNYKGDNECKVIGRTCYPEGFVCDFFRRKNSGAYRRKLRKKRKEGEEK